jgi:hypothetical protein
MSAFKPGDRVVVTVKKSSFFKREGVVMAPGAYGEPERYGVMFEGKKDAIGFFASEIKAAPATSRKAADR